ncbi:jg21467 [Pararge aegeria aegeria]|uniref:Jg21467 protein n=1 Tax=Pararge aegeria aegeria TaxID=348720 RepID=A0A8S4RSE1_9NEOP|nr:jg21467 [Pararge aegeria aegeria]
MEVSHSLTLNETALLQLPDDKKPHFIFEWLRFLDKVLVAAHKSDLKSCQQKLVAQLVNLLRENLGAPARRLLARCLATLFSVGDTFLLFDTVNKCNDIIKVKDDSPSYLPTRLAAICCLGSMYEKLGRMMGRSYEETVTTLVRSMKSAESQTRLEIMTTLDKICVGMGTAAGAALREVSRAARAALLNERATPVRAAAANTIRHMLPLLRLSPADVDAIAAACLRAAHPSDYGLRCAVAELLGALIAATQAGEVNNINTKAKIGLQPVANKKDPPKNVISLEEALNLLMGAFLRGGTSFLKGEIIKSGSGVNREVRVCVTNAYVMFVQNMGGVWLERNMSTFLTHVLDLVANPKAASSHVDAVYSRKCINYILRNTLGKMLGEKAQASACREIIQIVAKQMNSIDFNPENAKDCNQETLFSQHLLVCALTEAGELAQQLGTSVHNLVADTSLNMIDTVCSVLEHPCVAARLGAASCLRYSAALAAILGAVRSSPLGVPHGRGKIAFNAAEQLLRSAGQSSRLTAARTNAGWLIVGAICTLGVPVVRGLLPRMLLLWRNSFPRSAKELESEKARGDAFTWQCIKMSKGSRQEAIQINVYTALLLALRTLAEQKSSLGAGQDAVKTAAMELIIAGLSANSATVRAAAASCAGRLCSCITEAESQALSERVIALARSSTSRPVRAAAAAAVGAVQRARGTASSATALPVLRALAQDAAAVEVQVWSLHALSVLVDASGPMFRGHVDSTLNLVLKLLFSAPPCLDELHRSIGRLLAALITVVGPELQEDSGNTETDFDAEGDDDQAEFHAESEQSTHPAVQPRWPTRVFAMECIQKVMAACEATGDSAHFDLVKAKEKLLIDPNADYLSLHLSDLVRMAFVGATGESDALRLCGLKTLQIIIQQYARAPEPDFPGHLLLEQYQAQVGAAVRPAFAGDTASHVTAAACDVCSAWIGCGVARDINDLRRSSTMFPIQEPDQRIDNVTGARAMAAILARAAPAPPLHYPCINHFRQCLDTRDHEVFASCCTVLRSVWSRTAPAECVSWWARALAARVVARAAAARHATDASHVKAAISAVTALDELVDAAPDAARIQMLWILVPIEFKTMMQQSSELRSKLENAVKANQANRNARRSASTRPAFDTRPAKPTIELKTDFSDFR